MNYQERKLLIEEAQRSANEVDRGVMDFAALVAGRLRRGYRTANERGEGWAGRETLKKLKKELRNFDITTGIWK